MKILIPITVLLFICIAPSVFAQQGKLDATFNTFDNGTSGEGFDGNVRTVIVNADKTSFVAGDFLNFNGGAIPRIIKLDVDGNNDASFVAGIGFDGTVVSGFKNTLGNKLLYGGAFLNYNGTAATRLARINLDGTLDTTFNNAYAGPNSGSNSSVQALAQCSDGSIVVAGNSITNYNGVVVRNVFKIDADGVLDLAFNANVTAHANGNITKIVIQTDGKILVCGSFDTFNGASSRGLVRLNPDGTLDLGFNANIGTASETDVLAMDIQSDGKIVLGGSFTSFNGTTVGRIVRLNTTGTIDSSFNYNKVGFGSGSVQVVRYTADGIYVAGTFTGVYNAGITVNRFVLLKNNGDLDLNFDSVTGLPNSSFYTIEPAINPADHQVYLGGSFSIYDATLRGKLARIDNEGALDVDFMSAGGVGANANVLKIIPLSSGKTMIFGSFLKFNGATALRIARLHEDGSLDTSFNNNANPLTAGANSNVRAAVQLPDGSFILAGDFSKYNDVVTTKIIKINAEGILDLSFNPPPITGNIYTLAVDILTGKIVVGGNFWTTVNGAVKNRLVRLDANGNADATFQANIFPNTDPITGITTGPSSPVVQDISLESGGKIIVAGNFTYFNGNVVTYLVRINQDGSLDQTYNNTAGPNGVVYALTKQSSGKLLVGGSFTTFGGSSKRRFLRVDNSGFIDLSFKSGIAFNNQNVRTIAVQPDDRIVLGGLFKGTFTGTDAIIYQVRRLVRLNADGSYDTSFSSNLNNACYTTAIDGKGRLMIGGSFNSVIGISKYRIARILACMDNTQYLGAGIGWSRGLPNKMSEVTINADLSLNVNTNYCNCSTATGKKLTVEEDVALTLEIDVFGNATTKAGVIEFKNNSSLIQNDNTAVNTGKIIYNRTSGIIDNFDYIYWSSPVENVLLGTVFSGSDRMFSYETTGWVAASGSMTQGKGYIIRNNTVTIHKATFEGIANNGNIAINTNNPVNSLVGNPYPSAIDADQFIIFNKEVLKGTLYFWTHNTPRTAVGNKVVYNAADYASYNLTGGTVTATRAPSTDVSWLPPTKNIAAGQSFVVGTKAIGNLVFNNSMRIADAGTNSSFLKPGNSRKITKLEKNRVWLNMSNQDGGFKQLLIGYIEGATNDFDNLYDGASINGNTYLDFYSVLDAKNYSIQGRGLPFTTADEVPLGFRSTIAGVFQITIDAVDGTLINQDIYLEDKMTNSVHNLKSGPYSFTTETGTYKDRFVLRYDATSKLGIDDVKAIGKQVIVSVKNSIIKINSLDQNITAVKVYDLKGSVIYNKEKLQNKEYSIENLHLSKQILIVSIQLTTGKWVSEEIVF